MSEAKEGSRPISKTSYLAVANFQPLLVLGYNIRNAPSLELLVES